MLSCPRLELGPCKEERYLLYESSTTANLLGRVKFFFTFIFYKYCSNGLYTNNFSNLAFLFQISTLKIIPLRIYICQEYTSKRNSFCFSLLLRTREQKVLYKRALEHRHRGIET